MKFGYSVNNNEEFVGEEIFSRGDWKGGDELCYHAEFSQYPGAIFLVVNGIVARADMEAGAKNILGASVGQN